MKNVTSEKSCGLLVSSVYEFFGKIIIIIIIFFFIIIIIYIFLRERRGGVGVVFVGSGGGRWIGR